MILYGIQISDYKLPNGFDNWTPDQQKSFCDEIAKGLHEHRLKTMPEKIREKLDQWITE